MSSVDSRGAGDWQGLWLEATIWIKTGWTTVSGETESSNSHIPVISVSQYYQYSCPGDSHYI